jgi:hypothetical protein
MTAKMVIASAARKMDVRQRARKRKRIAEMRVPASDPEDEAGDVESPELRGAQSGGAKAAVDLPGQRQDEAEQESGRDDEPCKIGAPRRVQRAKDVAVDVGVPR